MRYLNSSSLLDRSSIREEEKDQTLDNNCEGNNCDDAWNNLNINLEELTYFKKYRNTPYQDILDVLFSVFAILYKWYYFELTVRHLLDFLTHLNL